MTIEEIKALDIEGIETRSAEIRAALDNANAEELDGFEAELNAIEERKKEIAAEIEQRKANMSNILKGDGKTVVKKSEERKIMNPVEVRASVEYKNAWLKHMNGMELSEEETRTLTTGITGNTSGTATTVSGQSILVPTEIINNIWNLVEEQHSIVGDLTTYKTGTVIELIKHTETSGASIVAEGSAPSEETNTFAKLVLAGKDYAKFVELTYRMGRMSIDALQAYLQNEIADQIGYAIAEDAIATIMAAVPSGNKVTPTADATYADVCEAFGTLKGVKNIAIYATRKTIYGQLVGMVDGNGRPIFQADATGAAIGRVLGATIKVEDAVADGVILIGDASKCVNNVVQDIMLEADKEIKAHKMVYSGYACMECGVLDPRAFATITVGE